MERVKRDRSLQNCRIVRRTSLFLKGKAEIYY